MNNTGVYWVFILFSADVRGMATAQTHLQTTGCSGDVMLYKVR